MALTTPVAIIVFKRLDATKKMFEAVRAAAPSELFIIADGWRNDAEKEKCLAVREYLENAADWPCTVHKIYSDTNLGCKHRVVSGLNKVFSEVEEAIVIEDDCVLDQSFFPYCEELLERYRHEPRVMQITGPNIHHKNPNFSTHGASYYFSRFGEIWGWATWRRAWKKYDVNIETWPEVKASGLLSKRLGDPAVVDFWEHRFDEVYEARKEPRKFDAWAAQWVYAQLVHDGLSISPKTNLVTNYGDDEAATRALAKEPEENLRRPVAPLSFPLVHPEKIEVNLEADRYTLYHGFRIKQKPTEKVLFFLKQRFPLLHSTLKRLKNNFS